MAKKENKLTYLQSPLPSGRKYSKMIKRAWSGLNMRQTVDTGALSIEENISTLEAPYLVPSQTPENIEEYANPISMFGFDDFLLVIYRDGTAIKVDYITEAGTYTGVIKASGADENDEYPRCVVQFNVYIPSDDTVNGTYEKRLLIFPDKKSMFFETDALLNDENNDTDNDFKLYDMEVLVKEFTPSGNSNEPPETANRSYYYQNTKTKGIYRWVDDKSDSAKSGWISTFIPNMPNIKYAAVHLSRLFGVSDGSVYASGFNDYTNWNLDTIDEYNESNAWCSPAQANTKADGDFTGITVFQSHIVCFKRDFMHELYNTKNPFRIQDIYAEGAIDNRSIQDVDGRLIFVSDDNVKVYTGSNPRILSYYLGIDEYKEAVGGTDGRCYYLYCVDGQDEKHLFVYDTIAEQWSEQSISNPVLNFAHNKNGMYMLCSDGVYKMDTGEYGNWCFETDLITNQTVDIKHIKKIQLFADVADGATIKVYMLYDDEEFDKASSQLVYSGKGLGQKVIRVKPRQTANYGIKLHVEGSGYVKLYQLEISVEAGGSLYV